MQDSQRRFRSSQDADSQGTGGLQDQDFTKKVAISPQLEDQAARTAIGLPGSPWSRYIDSSTGKFYYYNRQTGESSWTVPTMATIGMSM